MNTTREERAWLRCLANEAWEGRARETLLRALDDADAAGEVADAANAKLLAKVRTMRPNARAKFFRTADPATIEALTEPCNGEAHSNAHIDHCMVCLYCTWGRVLKAEPSSEVEPCNPTK